MHIVQQRTGRLRMPPGATPGHQGRNPSQLEKGSPIDHRESFVGRRETTLSTPKSLSTLKLFSFGVIAASGLLFAAVKPRQIHRFFLLRPDLCHLFIPFLLC
jgi:hypothetical protein